MGSVNAPNRDLLLSTHTFPCEYVLKAFGPATPQFREAVKACARAVLGEEGFSSRERISSGGRQTCVSLDLNARSVDDVIAVYDGVHSVADLKLIL